MINLLPEEIKRDMAAARMNVALLSYNVMVLVSIAVLGIFCLTFYFILNTSQTTAYNTSSTNSAKAATYEEVRKNAESYKNNLSIAKSIFSNVTSYTDIINLITKLLPSGVVLDSLNLSDSTFGQQSSFSAHATSYAAATQLKEEFQSSGLFSNVYFQNLTVGDSSPDNKYPVSVVISAKLNKVGMQ